MKFVSLRPDGRLFLVIPDVHPMRAAAGAVAGSRFEGRRDGCAVYSYPATPEAWGLLRVAFTPKVADAAKARVAELEGQAALLDQAMNAKAERQDLAVDAHLRTEPMQHQVQAINFCWSLFQAGKRGAALLMEQGTGKSLVAVGLANTLLAEGSISWVLVVAPNSLKGTWGDPEDGEVALHSALEWQLLVLRGPRERRMGAWQRAMGRGAPWVVTNYDQFAVDPTGRRERNRRALDCYYAARDLVRQHPDGLLVCDESTVLKNPTAKRTRALQELARHFRYRLVLTGTPVTRCPLDVWSQFEVLEEGALGFRSYLAFERRYAVKQRIDFGGRRPAQVVVGHRNLDDLQGRVSRLSYRALAKDCLDLPPTVVKRIPVELSREQTRAIMELRRDKMAVVGDHRLDGRNVLVRHQKLAQVVGGYAFTLDESTKRRRRSWRDADVHEFRPNPKLQALEAFLETVLDDPERKAVVFAQYHPELAGIVAMGGKRGWGPVEFHGEVPEAQREEHRRQFNRDPSCRMFVSQYEAGSKGLNLTVADTVAFYSMTFDLEDFLQARKRVHRKGQRRRVTEAYFIGQMPTDHGRHPETMDHAMLEALRDKRFLADVVTGDVPAPPDGP